MNKILGRIFFLACTVLVQLGGLQAQSNYTPYTFTTLAGLAGANGAADGTGSAAKFLYPNGVAVDSAGNVYVADTRSSTIRKITSGGLVTTFAGTAGSDGTADGTGSAARFDYPEGVAVDSAGNVYVADTFNHTIRKITPQGDVTTLAGTANGLGSTDGTGTAAKFNLPYGVAVDSTGINVYVADTNNHTIRKITSGGVVTTLAGTAGSSGLADGTGGAAKFNYPRGVAVDSAGNVYVADTSNSKIRKITSSGVVTTLGGGSSLGFSSPYGVAVDSSNNVYVGDTGSWTIRIITSSGAVSILAGNPNAFGSADGTGSAALFDLPTGVAVDNAGIVYVADSENHTIRKGIANGASSSSSSGGGRIPGSSSSSGSSASAGAPVEDTSGGAPSLWFFGAILLLGAARRWLVKKA